MQMPLVHQKFLLLLFSSIFLVIYGCKKEDDPLIEARLSSYLPEFYGWKPGSYWVMRDSLSGNIDSFYVSEYRQYTIPFWDHYQEAVMIKIRQTPLQGGTETVSWQLLLNNVIDNYLYFEQDSTQMYFTNIIMAPSQLKYDSVVYNGIMYYSVFRADTYYSFGSVPDSRQKMSLVMNKANGFLYLKTSSDQGLKTYSLIRSSLVR